MAASGLSATGRKNLCVQVSYQAQAPNCSRDLLGIAVSKPPEPASCNHSTVLGSPRPLQSGSLKHPPREGCVSTVNSSEHGQIVGGHRGAQGIHHKHIQKGGAVSQFSEVGSCQTPSAKPAPQEPCSLKYSKATKAQSVVVRHPHRAGSIALPKQVLAEAPEGVLPNLCCEPSVNKPPVTLHTAKVSASGNLIPPKKGSGNCSKKPIVEDSLPAEVVLEAQIDHLAAGHLDGVGAHVKEGSGNGNVRLNSQISISNYLSPSNSFYSGNQLTDATSVKDSFVTAKVSDGTSSIEKTSGSAKLSDPHPDFVESEKSSICGGSTGSDVSEESSSSSSFSSSVNKPHKANDSRWEAIQAVRSRDGVLGVSHFRLLKRLGCGDIGSVYLAELCGTKSHFAMKIMDKAALGSRKKLPRAQTEREILQSLDHPFLPTLYAHFETDKFSCLVMEFCPGGDLHTLRQRQPGKYFPEQAARFYVAEVLLALEYLHMLGIIYRDLKPENVLVRDDGHIMLSDFDLSLRCAFSPSLVKCSSMDKDPSKKNSAHCVQPSCIEPTCTIQPSCVQPTCFSPGFLSSRSKKERKAKPKNEVCNQVSLLPELIVEPTNARSMSFVGTHEYLAPEIIKGEGHGSAVDWWTFGIFLYELLFGKTPFKGSGNRATLFNVVGQPLRFPESPMVSFAARDLIRGLLVKEPQHRLAYRRGATEVKQHPFFQSMNWALIRCTNPPEVPKPFEIVDFPPRAAEVVDASTSEKMAGVDVKPSGNYLEIDFF